MIVHSREIGVTDRTAVIFLLFRKHIFSCVIRLVSALKLD